MGDRVYLHETIHIIGHHRAAYNHHMTANFGATARIERGLLCVGVFSTVGSTEHWPQTMNLWEFTGGWDGVAANFRHEFSRPQHQDTSLETWWSDAALLRSGGYDRLVVATEWSPTLADLVADPPPAECHYHELVTLHPGGAGPYLEAVATHRLDVATQFGFALVGAYRTAMVNDSEAILVWAVPTWEHWAAWEAAQFPGDTRHEPVAAWRQASAPWVVDWRSKLMVASPLSPVITGEIL